MRCATPSASQALSKPSAVKQEPRSVSTWVTWKGNFRRRERAAMHWLGRIARRDPDLFVLWRQGVRPEVGV